MSLPADIFKKKKYSSLTPRYLAFDVSFKVCESMLNEACMSFRLLVIRISSHLSGLNICKFLSHSCKVSYSSVRQTIISKKSY